MDSAGNQSQMSNIQCVDISECGTYRLPNVFTPNDDTYNDRFKAFEFTSVERINLIIFNRWEESFTKPPIHGFNGTAKTNKTTETVAREYILCLRCV